MALYLCASAQAVVGPSRRRDAAEARPFAAGGCVLGLGDEEAAGSQALRRSGGGATPHRSGPHRRDGRVPKCTLAAVAIHRSPKEGEPR